MAAPVVVTSPAGNPPEGFIYLFANEPAVMSTPFAGWEPAPAAPNGAARVQLSNASAFRSFIPKGNISRVPADLAAARGVGVISLKLSDAAWSRIFTELTASNLFAGQPYAGLPTFEEELRALTPANPVNLALVAADWRVGVAFAMPGGQGAAAQATRAALERVRFLNVLAPTALESAGTELPLLPLALLVGAMGHCLSAAARQDEMSSVQLVAEFMRAHGAPGASDGALASRSKKFVLDNRLPFELRAHEASEEECRAEIEDGFLFYNSAEGRRAVEGRRVNLLDNGSRPTLALFVLNRSRDSKTAYGALCPPRCHSPTV